MSERVPKILFGKLKSASWHVCKALGTGPARAQAALHGAAKRTRLCSRTTRRAGTTAVAAPSGLPSSVPADSPTVPALFLPDALSHKVRWLSFTTGNVVCWRLCGSSDHVWVLKGNTQEAGDTHGLSPDVTACALNPHLSFYALAIYYHGKYSKITLSQFRGHCFIR